MRKLITSALAAVVIFVSSTAFAHDSSYYERRVDPNAGAAIVGVLAILGGVAIIAGASENRRIYHGPRYNPRLPRSERSLYFQQHRALPPGCFYPRPNTYYNGWMYHDSNGRGYYCH